MQPFVVVRNHRSQMESIAKIKRIVKDMEVFDPQTGYFWIGQEHEIYVEILKLHFQEIQSQGQRKAVRIFAVISRILKTRTPKQVKTHHQKMIQRWKDIPGIIKYSCSSYRYVYKMGKEKEEEIQNIELELPPVKDQVKEAEEVARQEKGQNYEERKIENNESHKLVYQHSKVVEMVKEEVDYDRYYPFLQIVTAEDLYNPQYTWNASNWGYGATQSTEYYPGQNWI